MRFSERPEHLGELAVEAIEAGADLLVVVGGDGSANEVVSGVLAAGKGGTVELAFVPQGTGRDVARSLRIPRDPAKALEAIVDGTTRTVDAGHATFVQPDGEPGERWFVNFAGAGISGAIARRANTSSKALGGRISFLIATVATFIRWKSGPMVVEVDGERRVGTMLEVLAMNGDNTAGGMLMAPDAKPDDGVFDLVVIGDVTKLDFLLTFPKIYRGTHVRHPRIDVVRARTVSIEAGTPLPIVIDGEQPGTTPARFTVVPGALRIRVPKT